MASLTIVRQRQEERRMDGDHRHEPASPAAVDLDQLRAAGF
ncbi:MAG TPA: hypothetical protein VFE05_10495 [Longimicrobiaceae bacterium]|nr:hypothetical protein [Longimicrobiaceae bacterium]